MGDLVSTNGTTRSPVRAPESQGRRTEFAARLLLLLGVAGFLVLGGLEATRDSATFDEPVYVSSGLAAILHHDVADNAEHPPLFKVLAALPVLAVHPVVPSNGHWDANDERSYSARFVRAQLAAGTMQRVTEVARIVPLAECAAVAWILFLLAGGLFGAWPGVVAALLWLSDPLVLGLGHLNGVDLPFAMATALVSLALVGWLTRRDNRSLWWLGVACGAVASAQTTGLVVVGLAVAVVIWSGWRAGRRGWSAWQPALLVLLAAWVVVWIVYLVLDPAVLVHSWVVLPQPYVNGISYLAGHDFGAAPGFLVGRAWEGANPWFWPVSVVVKVSTPVLLVLLAGTVAFVLLARRGTIEARTVRRAVAAVVLPAVVLFALQLPNPRTLGVRYLLPSLALWGVVASPLALLVGRRVAAAALVVVLAAAGAATAASFPHSLASTAPPFRPGFRMATDSNVDWGQDLNQLSSWSATHHPYVAYFGPRGITPNEIPGARALVGVAPRQLRGWVAASATDLTSADRQTLGWLRGYCPVATLGGTILIYRFARPPTDQAGPAAPAGVCVGTYSHRVAS